MTDINHHNSRLTNRCEVIMTDTPPARTYINHELITRIQAFYEIHGTPTPDEIDAQLKRTRLTCKTIKG